MLTSVPSTCTKESMRWTRNELARVHAECAQSAGRMDGLIADSEYGPIRSHLAANVCSTGLMNRNQFQVNFIIHIYVLVLGSSSSSTFYV